MSEVYGALVAVAVAVAVTAALMSVGGRTAGLIVGAGEAASQSIEAASSPLIMEAWVEAGGLKARFYSPGAPVESVVVLKPGEGVVARQQLPEPAVEGVVEALKPYDCSPVVLGVETVGGGLKLYPHPYTCNTREQGGAGPEPAVNIGGQWLGLASLGAARVVSLGSWEPVDVVLQIQIDLDRSCSPTISALGSEASPDGSGGYSEEPLGAVETGLGLFKVYGFALCTGDGLWAGVRLEPPGDMVLRGWAEARGSIAFPGKPRGAVEALVYSDGLETVAGWVEAWMVSPRYSNGATEARGDFATATGLIVLLHSREPGEARASIEATITLEEAAPLTLSTHTATLPHTTPTKITVLACRDQAPSLGVDSLLNPPPRLEAVVGGVARELKPGQAFQAAWAPGLEAMVSITPAKTMGTPVKPLVKPVEGEAGYRAAITPVPSPCGAPAKPLIVIQDTHQARTLAHLQLQGARLVIAPAEEAAAQGYKALYKAWIDAGRGVITVYGSQVQITPQQAYAAIKALGPVAEADIVIAQ
ncbi:hypothetical protein ACAM_0469 [Aeropyrum camini SY1 = JCM 12091]|uniref:Uncharacterized protein n=1 Tax=Aeropyrum camini SY1 = JCM 12091 TaxID=1198449 RepID=U3TD86_9CREN|nr:hypothetical protein ACAM_0469 [Aeropyrum camini SY1 = JCM 12091]